MLGVARVVRMGAHAVAAPGPLEDPRPPRDSEAAQELRGTGDMGSPLKGGKPLDVSQGRLLRLHGDSRRRMSPVSPSVLIGK
jgi:hypothetical protein